MKMFDGRSQAIWSGTVRRVCASTKCAFVLLLLLFLISEPYLQAAPLTKEDIDKLYTLDVIPEYEGVVPGEVTALGFQFSLEKGWHVYWKNPGTAGLPTVVTVRSSRGVQVQDLRYPLPTIFQQPSGERGYGYWQEAFFELPFYVDESLKAGDSTEIVGEVSWLLCSEELCIPGRKKFSITLAVQEGHVDARAGVFREWQNRFPVVGEDENFRVLSREQHADGHVTIRAVVEWPKEPDAVQVFVSAPRTLDVAVQAEPSRDLRSEIVFKIRQLETQGSLKEFEVLVVDGEGAQQRGRTFRVPLGEKG